MSHIPKHRRVKVFQLLVKGTTLPKILVKLIEKEDSAAAIAAQLALKYEVGEVMLAIDEISSIDTVKWINQLLANKKFACASNFKLVSGIMEKMFSLLEERTKQSTFFVHLDPLIV